MPISPTSLRPHCPPRDYRPADSAAKDLQVLTHQALIQFQSRLGSALTHTDDSVADHLTQLHRFISDQTRIDANTSQSLGGGRSCSR